MASRTHEGTGSRAYTLPELAEISAIDYRTLHNWQKRGMLHPSRRAATGSGSVNLFDATDALQVLILAELRRAGVEVRALEMIAGPLHELAGAIDGEELIVIAEDRVTLHSPTELNQSISDDRPHVVLSVAGAWRALRDLPAAA